MMSARLKTYVALGALLSAFLYSAWRAVSHSRRDTPKSGTISLSLGHWLLHAGMRESFDQAIADYQQLHPHVRIDHIPVPIRAYPAWVRTRLVGNTAPDITGMMTLNEELVARHFIPLTPYLHAPNPYNVGTDLEGVPWRETFVDGLDTVRQNLSPTSGEIRGVNLQLNTHRLYYNRQLLQLVTGSDQPPGDYAGFIALHAQVEAYNQRTGRSLYTVASCGPYAQYLFGALLPSQTQRLTLTLSPLRNLRTQSADLVPLFLRGDIDYDTPELRRSLELLRDVTQTMQPGFNQLQRDDALFAFLQQQAVTFYAGSWDYGVLVRDGEFETGVARLPTPTPTHPQFGAFMLGEASESGNRPEATLGVPRTSQHPEIAVDFLRYLSSQPVAARFTAASHRIAAIVGTPPPPDAPALAPNLEGEVNGFPIDFQGYGGNHGYNLFQRNLHLALGPRGDVNALAARLNEDMPRALRLDMQNHLSRLQRDGRQLDALMVLHLTLPEDDPTRARWTRLAETKAVRQIDRHRLLHRAVSDRE